MSSQVIPLIQVKGSPRERGRQQGDGAQAQITSMLATYRELLPAASSMNWDGALRESRKFLPHAEGAFPHFVEELRGISEGANVAFEDVWLLNCYEKVIESQPTSCTALAVRDDHTADGHVLMAHNEDWIRADRDHVYLVRSEPDDGPAFIGMTYGALLPNIGFNESGIGVAINSVYATDGQVGVPRIVFSRAVLSASTIGGAISACVPRQRAGGYNYLLADSHGELYSVETSATTHTILYGQAGWLVHTNHYLSPRMQALEQPGIYAGSHVRLNRARRLLEAQIEENKVTIADLQAILRDHVNYPNAICAHHDPTDPPHERDQTVISLVMDLTERVVWVAPGPPCQEEFALYRL